MVNREQGGTNITEYINRSNQEIFRRRFPVGSIVVKKGDESQKPWQTVESHIYVDASSEHVHLVSTDGIGTGSIVTLNMIELAQKG